VTLVRVLIEREFVKIITELEICRIYEPVLQTIKGVTRNLLDALNFIA
jgi:hypothetical protein